MPRSRVFLPGSRAARLPRPRGGHRSRAGDVSQQRDKPSRSPVALGQWRDRSSGVGRARPGRCQVKRLSLVLGALLLGLFVAAPTGPGCSGSDGVYRGMDRRGSCAARRRWQYRPSLRLRGRPPAGRVHRRVRHGLRGRRVARHRLLEHASGIRRWRHAVRSVQRREVRSCDDQIPDRRAGDLDPRRPGECRSSGRHAL